MAFARAVGFALIAFVIFDAALFNGAYVHQLGLALSQMSHLDWAWL
jgi:hypothetical protein